MDNVIIKRILRGSWICVVLIVLITSIYWLIPLLYPFLIAWIIAYAMNPFVRILKRSCNMPGWLAVCVALLVYVGGAAIILSAAVTRLVKELIHVAETLEVHIEEWRRIFIEWSQSDRIQQLFNDLNRFVVNNPGYGTTINKNIDHTAQTISTAVSRLVNGLLGSLVNLLTSLPNLGVILLVILLSTFFISKQWDTHMRYLAGRIPGPFRKTAGNIWGDLQYAFFGYIRAQFVLISITGIIVLIGLLVIGVDSAFTYAFLIGLVDLLPYLGVGTIMVPWLIYEYMTGDMATCIGLSILFGIIVIVRQLVEPKVLSSNVGLDPLPTLISMFVGMKLLGILGLIAGPVCLVIFGAFLRAGVFRDLRNYIVSGRLR